MGPISELIIFGILAACILVLSIMAVTAKKILRAAIYLLFVLIGVAGIYLLLNYHFLAAVQLSVYAGGIVVLLVFAIMLTSHKGEMVESHNFKKIAMGALASLAGIAVVLFAIAKHRFVYMSSASTGDEEINMKVIGQALVGTSRYQYLLPFEVLSVLLLACIIGGILIARKEK